MGLFLLSWVPARAADEPLEVITTVQKVVTDDTGRETLVDAPKAEPDETLVYRATYRNVGPTVLHELTATMPVPPGLTYLEGSAAPAAIEATVDGKAFFRLNAEPLPAPTTAWRALRWAPRDLSPGAAFTIELRARVVAAQSNTL